MKICIAQIRAIKGNIEESLKQHIAYIEAAAQQGAAMVMFPELSLTGYEPSLAKTLASTQDDTRFDIIQYYSDHHQITICAGMPTQQQEDLFISMLIFQPGKERATYSKQYLFPPEKEVFSSGKEQVFIQLNGQIIAPAICYELSNPEHSEKARQHHARFYMASVLNSVSGVGNDLHKLSHIAQQHQMTTFMANYVGQSGGYDCAGKSSVWDEEGKLLKQLDSQAEGLLIYDTRSKSAEVILVTV